jgi:RNA polymerase sigma-70 factor (ECF subfamily)
LDKKATIRAFQQQNERVIQRFYHAHRPKFTNWLKGRFQIVAEDDCLEIYQRSFTVLYLNIKRGKLNELEATLETYLFGIGKMILKEWWREKKIDQQFSDMDDKDIAANEKEPDLNDLVLFGNDSNNPLDPALSERLVNGLNELGEPCRTILKLYYWERNSMEAIANKTGYKNEQGAKKKKYLCLVKLREIMKRP